MKKDIKYNTTHHTGEHLFIPQRLLTAIENKEEIRTLFIHEGEKYCTHGILSVGISCIQNIAQKGQIPPDLVRIIETCKVKEIVLLLGSDCDELSSDLSLTKDVKKRPEKFFYTARNFQEYIRQLKNKKLYLDLFVGIFIKNQNSLTGKHHQLFKITLMGDQNLQELCDSLEKAV